MAKTRENRKEESRQRKVQEIITAALGLFSRKGYQGTTLEDVAHELGYAKASLYYYFPSKEALVKAMVGGALCDAIGRMDQLSQKTQDPVENLADLIGYYIEDFHSEQGFFKIYHQVRPYMAQFLSEDERQIMEKEMKAMSERIIGMIQRGIDQGRFLEMEPQILGEMTLGMLAGVMTHATQGVMQSLDQDSLARTLTKIIIKGISK